MYYLASTKAAILKHGQFITEMIVVMFGLALVQLAVKLTLFRTTENQRHVVNQASEKGSFKSPLCR